MFCSHKELCLSLFLSLFFFLFAFSNHRSCQNCHVLIWFHFHGHFYFVLHCSLIPFSYFLTHHWILWFLISYSHLFPFSSLACYPDFQLFIVWCCLCYIWGILFTKVTTSFRSTVPHIVFFVWPDVTEMFWSILLMSFGILVSAFARLSWISIVYLSRRLQVNCQITWALHTVRIFVWKALFGRHLQR